MIRHIKKPTQVKAAGNKPKIIEEFIGRVNSGSTQISIARMQSPPGWIEPGQCPEFDEYTLVLEGQLHVKTQVSLIVVNAGEAVVCPRGEWVQYSTPNPPGAKYIAICLPAFSPDSVHRDT